MTDTMEIIANANRGIEDGNRLLAQAVAAGNKQDFETCITLADRAAEAFAQAGGFGHKGCTAALKCAREAAKANGTYEEISDEQLVAELAA